MKKVLALVLILMSNSNASYSKEYGVLPSLSGIKDSLNKYCSELYTDHSAQCLSAYLAYRCTVNFMFTNPGYVMSCVKATDTLVKMLDITQIRMDKKNPDSLKLQQIAFSRQVLKSFLEPQATFQAKMNQYQTEFSDSYRFGNPHSLWETTLADSAGNKQKALQTMVTVFQDFYDQVHLDYVGDVASYMSKNYATRMTDNMTSLAPFFKLLRDNKSKTDHNPNYAIYPKMKESDKLHPFLHHFYTPAYLSFMLQKHGFDEGVAFYSSLLFHATYEFIKLDQKMGTKRWPFQDPIAFDAKKYQLQVQKIYTGYQGALFGIGKESSALSYADFEKHLAADPSSFITSLAY